MKLETEKNIASEIDNLMENCDSTQTNNITRKKLCRILIECVTYAREYLKCALCTLYFFVPWTAYLLTPSKEQTHFSALIVCL